MKQLGSMKHVRLKRWLERVIESLEFSTRCHACRVLIRKKVDVVPALRSLMASWEGQVIHK